MTLSEKSKTPMSGSYVIEDNSSTPVYRLNSGEMPNTTDDMNAAFRWLVGDTLYGTHAKDNEALKAYREDMNEAKSTFEDYHKNVIYVDTLSSKKTVGDQLKELNK